MMTTADIVTLTRPSRSGPQNPAHVLHLDGGTFTPIDPEHPCSCHAGTKGQLCWALLSVLSVDALELAPRNSPHRKLIVERGRVAGELLAIRNRIPRRMH